MTAGVCFLCTEVVERRTVVLSYACCCLTCGFVHLCLFCLFFMFVYVWFLFCIWSACLRWMFAGGYVSLRRVCVCFFFC